MPSAFEVSLSKPEAWDLFNSKSAEEKSEQMYHDLNLLSGIVLLSDVYLQVETI